MSLIKQHLHKLEEYAYPIEIVLELNEVEYIISYLEETDDVKANAIADELRNQTYA